jgi:hypothetical protein
MTALPSNWGRDATSPFDIFEMEDRDEKIITIMPAASAASAMAFPCAISVEGDLLFQACIHSADLRYNISAMPLMGKKGINWNSHNQ